MVKEIVTDIEQLHVRSGEISEIKDNLEIRQLREDLVDTMRYNNLKSLSAVQIGKPVRMFVIDFNGEFRCFINPLIKKATGCELAVDECSSIPNKKFIIPRNNKLSVDFLTLTDEIKSYDLLGVGAMVAQHEIQHLDGIILSDIALEIDDDFEKASEDERFEVISKYLEVLTNSAKSVDEAVRTDENTKQIMDAIDFIRSVNEGKTILEKSEE